MIGSDISLTFLLIFYLCSNYETGPSCICRSNQSVHQRLKIHLNFQNLELTSVHYNSGQWFQHSNVVHCISGQPQEVHCFIASADNLKKKHCKWKENNVRISICVTKNSCNDSCLIAIIPKKMEIGTWHMNWFLALLDRPSLSNFFLWQPWM